VITFIAVPAPLPLVAGGKGLPSFANTLLLDEVELGFGGAEIAVGQARRRRRAEPQNGVDVPQLATLAAHL